MPSSISSDRSDEGVQLQTPQCRESLQPGALLVQYQLQSGPPVDDNMEDVYLKLSTMEDIFFQWHETTAITYEFLPTKGIHRERVMTPFKQKIGKRTFNRIHIEPDSFFQQEASTWIVVYQPWDNIVEKYGLLEPEEEMKETPSAAPPPSIDKPTGSKDIISGPTEVMPPSKENVDGTSFPAAENSERGIRIRLSSSSSSTPSTDTTSQPRTNRADTTNDYSPVGNDSTTMETTSDEPKQQHNLASTHTGNEAAPEQQQQQATSNSTVNESPQWQPANSRTRRHPAKFRVITSSSPEELTCLLFRPLAGASLQTANKKTIAFGFQQLQPRPLAIRKIRDGRLAVDFPLNMSTDHIKQLDNLAGIPVKVEPPHRRPGTSGVIRGDFAAAEEVHDLYAIRMAKVCQQVPSCSLCASLTHTYQACPRQTTRCINCGGPHPPSAPTISTFYPPQKPPPTQESPCQKPDEPQPPHMLTLSNNAHNRRPRIQETQLPNPQTGQLAPKRHATASRLKTGHQAGGIAQSARA